MPTLYSFQKYPVNVRELAAAILASLSRAVLATAAGQTCVGHIQYKAQDVAGNVRITFATALGTEELAILTSIVSCHVPSAVVAEASSAVSVDEVASPSDLADLELRFRLLLKAYVLSGLPMPRGLEDEFVNAVNLTS